MAEQEMITITLDNIWANVPPGSGRFQASNILRFRSKGFNFSPKYKAGTWDGYTRMVTKSGNFPAGLAPYLIRKLAEQGTSASLCPMTAPPSPHPCLAKASLLVTPRPDQAAAVDDAAGCGGRGIIHFPTGTGKTIILAALIHRLAVPTLVLCHRTDLMRQLADRLKTALDVPALVGMVGGGEEEWNWITVATFQSLHHRLKSYPEPMKKLLEKYQAVMVDEVHHVGADTFGGVMKALPNAFYRYGFSATPTRQDDPETFFKVTGWLGETVSQMTLETAVDEGHIVPADVFMVMLDGDDTQEQAPYQEVYTRKVVESGERNKIVVDLARKIAVKGNVLILVERIEHGRKLLRLIQEAYLDTGLGLGFCDFINGEETATRRWEGLTRFRAGTSPVLIATNILEEGIDMDVRTIILAGAGKAPHLTIQRVGRGTRTAEGKDRVMVFDFMDKGWRTRRDVEGKVKKGKDGRESHFAGVLALQALLRLKTYQSEPAFSVCEITRQELTALLG